MDPPLLLLLERRQVYSNFLFVLILFNLVFPSVQCVHSNTDRNVRMFYLSASFLKIEDGEYYEFEGFPSGTFLSIEGKEEKGGRF
jgi:hypothetical protein